MDIDQQKQVNLKFEISIHYTLCLSYVVLIYESHWYLEVSYQEMLLWRSVISAKFWIWRWMVLNMFCRVYICSSWIKVLCNRIKVAKVKLCVQTEVEKVDMGNDEIRFLTEAFFFLSKVCPKTCKKEFVDFRSCIISRGQMSSSSWMKPFFFPQLIYSIPQFRIIYLLTFFLKERTR